MEKNYRVSVFYVISAFVMSIASALFGTTVFLNYIDESNGLFVKNTNVPLLFVIYVLMCVLFFSTSLFLFKQKNMSIELYEKNGILSGGAILSCVFIAASSGYSVYTLFVGTTRFAIYSGIELIVNRIETVGAFIGIAAALFYGIVTFSQKADSKVAAVLSLFPPLWVVVRIMSVYFDGTVLLNNPANIFHEIALVSLVLFQLSESRFRVNRAKPVFYFLSGLICVLLMATWVVPQVYFLAIGKTEFSYTVTGLFAELFLTVYVFGRIWAYAYDCKYAVKKVCSQGNINTDTTSTVEYDDNGESEMETEQSKEDYQAYNDYFLKVVDGEEQIGEQLSFDAIASEEATEIPLATAYEPTVNSAESEAFNGIEQPYNDENSLHTEDYKPSDYIKDGAVEVMLTTEDEEEAVSETDVGLSYTDESEKNNRAVNFEAIPVKEMSAEATPTEATPTEKEESSEYSENDVLMYLSELQQKGEKSPIRARKLKVKDNFSVTNARRSVSELHRSNPDNPVIVEEDKDGNENK